MRAVLCRSFGPPEALSVEEVPVPRPGPGEVLVRVDAAGVNFADVLMVAGQYQARPPFPFVPGLEFAGTVVEAAPDVTEWRAGDHVMGAPPFGAFAEYIAVGSDRLFPVPAGMPAPAACGFVIAYGTACFALKHRAGLRPGETLLVTGAGGGVGIAAVDVGKRLGARVLAAAGSPEKLAAAEAHGADEGVDCGTQDLRSRVRELTGGRGFDVLLDTVGGDLFDASLRSTAHFARLLVVGFAGGRIPQVPADYLLLKNLSVLGVGFGAIVAMSPASARSVIAELEAMHSARPFRPELAGEYPLENAGMALSHLAERKVTGKLAIVP
ncbi:MAG: NADPH:quinone oxidoreductase family protein [Deltaproteobacteria bacterium]|nr:NADPH:quinone oxidoreductase family protein [Deltaproteobacteria bacterium]